MKTYLKACFAALAILVTGCVNEPEPDQQQQEERLPTLSINSAYVQEGDDLLFTITLSNASEKIVAFNYRTIHETTSDKDFETVAAKKTVSISPGSTSLLITIKSKKDSVNENSESFKVILSDPVNAKLSGQYEGTGTLTNIFVQLPHPENPTGGGDDDFGDGEEIIEIGVAYIKAKIDGKEWIADRRIDFQSEIIGKTMVGYGTRDYSDTKLSVEFFEKPDKSRTYNISATGPSDIFEVRITYSPTFFSENGEGPVWVAQSSKYREIEVEKAFYLNTSHAKVCIP